jgi:transposase
MMGRQGEDRAQLFYEFCLEDRVPGDHLLRKIDRFLDLRTLRQELAPFYSTIGRPSIDPELMIRMLVVGYCVGTRSERRLCERLVSIWRIGGFVVWDWKAGFPIIRPSPTRHGRFRDSDAFRHLFEMVVRRAIAEGLVGGEGFAVDASLIAADANADSHGSRPGFRDDLAHHSDLISLAVPR